MKVGRTIFQALQNEDEESFLDQSDMVDVLSARDKDCNTILHIFGMQNWTTKKTEIIKKYCDDRNLLNEAKDIENQAFVQFPTSMIAIIINFDTRFIL